MDVRRRSRRPRRIRLGWALAAATTAGCASPEDFADDLGAVETESDSETSAEIEIDGDAEDADLYDDEDRVELSDFTDHLPDERVVDPTPVPPGQLMGMVQVSSSMGGCSGMLIADDRVLTAAHCVCTESVIGGNVCTTSATVTFQDDPSVPGTSRPTRSGTATWHPGYNPSWIHARIEDDIAVIDLSGVAPSYVAPFRVSSQYVWPNSSVLIVGFGNTGSGCEGSAGTLNFQITTIDGYEDDGKIMKFNPQVICGGDSGGAVMNTAGTTIFGVNSGNTSGGTSKSIAVRRYFDWIKGLTCSSSFWSRCDDKAEMCRCSAGLGDCDVDADCEPGLSCAYNVGAQFGYSSSADVCVPPGPIEGICGCQNSGFGNVCTPAFNDCSATFVPSCNPAQGSCGPCTCQ